MTSMSVCVWPRESHKSRIVERSDVERRLGRIVVNEVLKCLWRIVSSGKGSKVLRPSQHGGSLSGFREGLCQRMVFDVHSEDLVDVRRSRTFRCEGPWNMNLQLSIILASVSLTPYICSQVLRWNKQLTFMLSRPPTFLQSPVSSLQQSRQRSI